MFECPGSTKGGVWRRTNETARVGVVDLQHYEMTLVDPICYGLFLPAWLTTLLDNAAHNVQRGLKRSSSHA